MRPTDQEIKELIDQIESAVRKSAIDYQGIIRLIDQWKADVEFGRPVERRLSIRRSYDSHSYTDTGRSESRTSGDFIGKEDYSSLEQLEMMVVALGLAFLAPHMMSKRVLDTISKYSGDQQQDQQERKLDPIVRFLGVATTETSQGSTDISHSTIEQSQQSTIALADILNEIGEEAELPKRISIDRGDTN